MNISRFKTKRPTTLSENLKRLGKLRMKFKKMCDDNKQNTVNIFRRVFLLLNFTNLKYHKQNIIILTADREYGSDLRANCGIAINFLADMRK